MTTDKQTFAIIGAGLAGAKAAEALREDGFAGRIVLVGEETERRYERPPLSKEYVRGEAEREKVFVHAADFYADRDIELRVGDGIARELEDQGVRTFCDAYEQLSSCVESKAHSLTAAA